MLNAYVHDVRMYDLVTSFTEGIMLTPHVDMMMKLQKDRDFDVITCDSEIQQCMPIRRQSGNYNVRVTALFREQPA